MIHHCQEGVVRVDRGKVQRKNAEYQETLTLALSIPDRFLLLLLSPRQSAFLFNLGLLVMKVPFRYFNARSKQQQAAAAPQRLYACKSNSNSTSGSTSSTTNNKQYPV